MVEASTPMRSPRTSPRSAIKARTQPNTVSCTSWGRRLRVFDSQEWSGTRSVASEGPEGSRFKGYETLLVRDVAVSAEVLRYRRERRVTSAGEPIGGPRPPCLVGGY